MHLFNLQYFSIWYLIYSIEYGGWFSILFYFLCQWIFHKTSITHAFETREMLHFRSDDHEPAVNHHWVAWQHGWWQSCVPTTSRPLHDNFTWTWNTSSSQDHKETNNQSHSYGSILLPHWEKKNCDEFHVISWWVSRYFVKKFYVISW